MAPITVSSYHLGVETEALGTSDDWLAPRLQAGLQVDQYKILRLLGRGGMAEVYLARDTKLGRKVVLKLISTGLADAHSAVEQFMQEAKALAQFSHPHIVTLYGFGEHAGEPYIAMEYVEGETLRERIRTEPPTVRECERFGMALSSALREAHARNIIHGDLKPENIVISRDGRLRVLDFGLAKFFSSLDSLRANAEQKNGATEEAQLKAAAAIRDNVETFAVQRTRGATAGDSIAAFSSHASGIKGTPAYMAPEQWANKQRTPAVDLWAFGIIFYELLSGSLPYQETDIIGLIRTVGSDAPAPPMRAGPDTPDILVSLVDRCLAKPPDKRPAAAEALRTFEQLVYGASTVMADRDSPFRGLDAFTESHASFFFGRDDEIGAFVERTRNECVLPIVGASGVGKSSLIQAGVVPRLREHNPWTILRMRPGSDPFRALAVRLVDEHSGSTNLPGARPAHQQANAEQTAKDLYDNPKLLALLLQNRATADNASVMLLVDQLEEVCTLVPDRETRLRFLACICQGADDPEDKVRIVFTCRDDFLTRVAESAEARVALSKVTVLRAPDNDALAQILTRSVAAVGYEYDDPSLVETMVQAVASEASALPLLQFAGTMLWDRRDQSTKTLLRAAYDSIGGVQGALATHANALMRSMTETQTRIVRGAMLRLVTPEGTRRVTLKRDLVAELGAGSGEVLQHLIDTRLLVGRRVLDEDYVELSHESLVHTWDRLAHWLEEGRDELLFLAQLEQAATLWEKRGRRRSEVWMGDALAEALRNIDRFAMKLAPLPEAFVAMSRQVERSRQRLRRILTVSGVAALSLIAIVSIVTAVSFGEKKQIAESKQAQAQAEGARSAFLRGDYIAAQAQLRSSLEMRDLPMARALWAKLSADPVVWQRTLPGNIYEIAWSPDGQQLAVASEDSSVYLLDRATAGLVVLRDLQNPATGVTFSPDGKAIVACDLNGNVALWQHGSAQDSTWQARTAVAHGWADCRVAFAPDSQYFVTSSWDGGLALWTRDLQLVKRFEAKAGPTFQARFSPDGTTIASAHADGALRLWSVATGELRQTLKGHDKDMQSVAFTRDGERVMGGGGEGTITSWHIASGKERWRVHAFDAAVRNLRFVDDGKVMLSSALDVTLKAWNSETGEASGTWQRHASSAMSLDVSGAGEVATGGYADRTVILWNLARKGADAVARGHTKNGIRVRVSPDGKLIASGSEDHSIRLWDAQSGAEKAILSGHRDVVNALAFSSDGTRLASGSYDNDIRVWDVPSRSLVRTLSGHRSGIYDVAFVASDRQLVSASNDQTLRLWNVEAGREAKIVQAPTALFGMAVASDGRVYGTNFDAHFTWRTLDAPVEKRPGPGWGVDVAKDGGLYALTPLSGEVTVRRAADGTIRSTFKVPNTSSYWGHFDPTGRSLAAPFSDGITRVFALNADGTAGALPTTLLKGHLGPVAEAVFDPTGRFVVTTGDDSTVRVWNSESGAALWRGVGLLERSRDYLTHRGWATFAAAPSDSKPAKWRELITVHGVLAHDAEETLCVATREGDLQLWNLATDSVQRQTPLDNISRVVASPEGCLVLAGDRAVFVEPRGEPKELSKGVTSIASQGSELFVLLDDAVLWFTHAQAPPTKLTVGRGATTAARLGADLAIGFANGTIELHRPDTHGAQTLSLENQPSGRLLHIAPGSMDTVVLGYANGTVGLWGRHDGVELARMKLHGPPLRVLNDGRRVHALTALGDFATLDVSSFVDDYCALLGQVWRTIPITWADGIASKTEQPARHQCVAAAR